MFVPQNAVGFEYGVKGFVASVVVLVVVVPDAVLEVAVIEELVEVAVAARKQLSFKSKI